MAMMNKYIVNIMRLYTRCGGRKTRRFRKSRKIGRKSRRRKMRQVGKKVNMI